MRRRLLRTLSSPRNDVLVCAGMYGITGRPFVAPGNDTHLAPLKEIASSALKRASSQ